MWLISFVGLFYFVVSRSCEEGMRSADVKNEVIATSIIIDHAKFETIGHSVVVMKNQKQAGHN